MERSAVCDVFTFSGWRVTNQTRQQRGLYITEENLRSSYCCGHFFLASKRLH